jgi:hypothetical protein
MLICDAEVSHRSRAARRGVEPTKEVAVKAPVKEEEYKPWLHNAQSAGISKKKKTKPLSRQQKLRQQRALEKADANVSKLERKVEDSKSRAKRVQARAKDWEELNAETEPKKFKKADGEATATPEESGEQAMEDVDVPSREHALPENTTDGATDGDVPAVPETAVVAEDVDEIT